MIAAAESKITPLARDRNSPDAAAQGLSIVVPLFNEAATLERLHARLIEEYLVYPFAAHDDGLDCASRWYDLEMQPPEVIDDIHIEPEAFIDGA